MTHKEFVPYAEALALKELHFDEPCFGIHYNEGLNPSFMIATQYGEHGAAANGGILAPLYQQAFRFFRENKIHSIVQEFDINNYMYSIDDGINRDIVVTGYKTYEEAELACIKKLIELVKEKK